MTTFSCTDNGDLIYRGTHYGSNHELFRETNEERHERHRLSRLRARDLDAWAKTATTEEIEAALAAKKIAELP